MKDFVFRWPFEDESITVSNDRGRIVATTNHIIFRGKWGGNSLIVEHVDASYEARGLVDGLTQLLIVFEAHEDDDGTEGREADFGSPDHDTREAEARAAIAEENEEPAVGDTVWLVDEDGRIHRCTVAKVWTYSLTGSKAVRLRKTRREGCFSGEMLRALPSDDIHKSLVAASKALLAAKAKAAEAARAAARQAQEAHALAIEEVDRWIEAEKKGGAR
jgi:hypothetical protein